MTLFYYKPSCFSYVNDHVHGLFSLRIPRFAHEKEEGLRQNKVTYVNKIKINASFYLYTVSYDNNIFGGKLGIFGGLRGSFYPSNTLDRTLAACPKTLRILLNSSVHISLRVSCPIMPRENVLASPLDVTTR